MLTDRLPAENLIADDRQTKTARSFSTGEEISFNHTDTSDKSSARERQFDEMHKSFSRGDAIEVNEKHLFSAKKVKTHVSSIFDVRICLYLASVAV